MTCYYIPDEKTLSILRSAFCTHSAVCSLHFVPNLHFVSGLQSAVYILYEQVSVAPIQFILVTVIRKHTQSTTKYICVTLFDIFVLFRVNTLSFCKNLYITYNISINSPIKRITLACIACLCLNFLTRTIVEQSRAPLVVSAHFLYSRDIVGKN